VLQANECKFTFHTLNKQKVQSNFLKWEGGKQTLVSKYLYAVLNTIFNINAEQIEYQEAQARLIFGSHETSPII
jgi:hypothetical protein